MSPAERARAAGWQRHESGYSQWWDRPVAPAEVNTWLVNSNSRVDACWTSPPVWYAPDAGRSWHATEDAALTAALDAAGVP